MNRPAADARQNARSGKRRKAERQERHAGEIIPPAPPCFPPKAAPFGGASAGMQSALPNPGGSLERRGLRKPWSLAGAVRAADAVQVCPFGPTCGGRLLSDKCRTVVLKEGISRCFGGGIVEVRPCSPEGHLSTLWGPRATSGARADGHKQAGFTPAVKHNARRASDAGRTACLAQTGLRASAFFSAEYQRCGARADGHKQAGFTPAVKRNARRASSAFVQCVLCKRAFGRRRFSLPSVNALGPAGDVRSPRRRA